MKTDILFLTVLVCNASEFVSIGQIELFTHFSFLGDITKELVDFGFHLVSVYLVRMPFLRYFQMDCPFISDESKYISGTLMALSAMLQLGLPHMNVSQPLFLE